MFTPAPGLPVFCCLSGSPIGACGTTGRNAAPAAPALLVRASRMQSTRARSGASRTGHRTQVSPAFRTRMGFSACSMSPGIATLAGACLVRANCCPDMHLGRPPAWSASIACLYTDPRLPPVIRKPSGPTSQRPPHPAPHYGDGHDAPLIGTGRSKDIPVRTKVHDREDAVETNLWRNLW